MNNQNFQLLSACPPPLASGKYSLTTEQEVTVLQQTEHFTNQLEFYVAGNHFTIPPEEIYSIYPAVNATGGYGDSFGHITFQNKTLPWCNSLRADASADLPAPWLALISVAADEPAVVKEMKISAFLDTNQQHPNIFSPMTKDPGPVTAKPDALCRVIDLPKQLYLSIMPREDELGYLCHAKKVDLQNRCDAQAERDGYFSVVASNRFIPTSSNEQTVRKSTFHLVSLEGFSGALPTHTSEDPLKKYDTVRLISLYSWDVYSRMSPMQGFDEIIKKISVDVMSIKNDGPELFKRGYVPLKHVTRTGEPTVSLYRGPLSPFPMAEREVSCAATADGNILYDPTNGLFDMSYAAAWQLGRLLALRNKSIAASIVRWRRSNKKSRLQAVHDEILTELQETFAQGKSFQEFLQTELCPELANDELIAPVSEKARLTYE